ncbi:hypothetical protein HanRHA438_Chr08g0331441 [Helianthus annuus]|nr:hypothetical protein HanRHA438_Chr08g0331441 [Helianthus annuus]
MDYMLPHRKLICYTSFAHLRRKLKVECSPTPPPPPFTLKTDNKVTFLKVGWIVHF